VPTPHDTAALEDSLSAIIIALLKHPHRVLAEPPGPSTQIAIGREFDENLHSDYISALLCTRTVGDLAHAFLARLVEETGGPQPSRQALQLSYREVRLDEVDPSLVGTSVGARRLDVLVKTPELVLVIEDKIWSGESEQQTEDYARVVRGAFEPQRRAHLVLLSPRGIRASDPAFKALSYPDLHRALALATKGRDRDGPGMHLARDYLNTLAAAFVYPAQVRLQRSVALLKEKGHEFDPTPV